MTHLGHSVTPFGYGKPCGVDQPRQVWRTSRSESGEAGSEFTFYIPLATTVRRQAGESNPALSARMRRRLPPIPDCGYGPRPSSCRARDALAEAQALVRRHPAISKGCGSRPGSARAVFQWSAQSACAAATGNCPVRPEELLLARSGL